MANLDFAHSDDEAPRSRCSSRSDRETRESELLYEDDCDRDSPPCGIERRARYAAHAGGLLAGAALGYFL